MRQDPTHPTGVLETSSHTQPETVAARERKADAAVEMYINKDATLKKVCKKLGYPSEQAALAAIERRLGEHSRSNPRTAASVREMISRRWERVTRSVMPKATDESDPEHLAAVAAFDRLATSYAKLHGANAPQQIVVSNPAAEQIETLAAQILSKGSTSIPAGDIFGDDADDEEVLALEQRRADKKDDIVDAVIVEDDGASIARELDAVDERP